MVIHSEGIVDIDSVHMEYGMQAIARKAENPQQHQGYNTSSAATANTASTYAVITQKYV